MYRFVAGLLLLLVFSPAQAQVINVDNVQLKQLLEQGVPIIDVRRPEEWRQTGVVKGSHLMTFFDKRGNYDVEAWMAKLIEIAGPEDPFILICRTGNRTGTISRFLDQKLRYQKVHNVTRGITDWKAKGHPTSKPET